MSNSALITMLVTEVAITVLTIYFFVRMLTAKPKDEPDSFTEE